MAEHGFGGQKLFSSTDTAKEVREARQQMPIDAIRRIQRDCIAANDDMRWLLPLSSVTLGCVYQRL